MNNYTVNHITITGNSYLNRTQVKTTECTNWSLTPHIMSPPAVVTDQYSNTATS